MCGDRLTSPIHGVLIVSASQTADSLNERLRRSTAHPPGVYNFTNYLAYAIYPPLYIAGPIMTFNDFMWQVCYHSESSSISNTDSGLCTSSYADRTLFLHMLEPRTLLALFSLLS
jgi:D-alanyl-lipoteichoic acid acyltransferase DltB (MBOAT superfamily)